MIKYNQKGVEEALESLKTGYIFTKLHDLEKRIYLTDHNLIEQRSDALCVGTDVTDVFLDERKVTSASAATLVQ